MTIRAADYQDKGWPTFVMRRLEAVDATAQAKLAEVNERLRLHAPKLTALFNQAMTGHAPDAVKLRRLITCMDYWDARVMRDAPACRTGCAHCCHIPVMLTRLDAERLGKAIGVKPADVPHFDPDKRYGKAQPCPFLTDGRCGIYAHRPFACRNHYNLDMDGLLCDTQYFGAPVPYAAKEPFESAYYSLGDGGVGDVRDYFPRGLKR